MSEIKVNKISPRTACGTTNGGGGGGGVRDNGSAGNGGNGSSGVVVIRYNFQWVNYE